MVKLSSSPCRIQAERMLDTVFDMEDGDAYGVDGAVGKSGDAGGVGNGVQTSLGERSSAGDDSGSKSSNAVCGIC
jgi:hypothetical protein